ncbi:MAG TPA: ABC transporter permease [Clostridiales bacterium]|nr:ABC transporter permease [Clostridiales bacterium]
MSKHLYINVWRLVRFILRKDRIRLPVWVISIAVSTIVYGAVIPGLYPTNTDRLIMAKTMRNPAITAMLGPGYGLDNYTDGAMMAHFMLVFTHLAVAIMSILLTTRHTREDEEEGRIEMIRSLPVGRLSALTATILIAILSNIVLSLASGFGLFALGFESMDLNGSLLYGASLGTIGIFFAVLTGLFAQLTSDTRATTGYSFAFLILAYIVRGIGDVGNETLSLITPLGLILRTEVYVNNYWWPIFVSLGVSIIIFGISLYLNSIRDIGAGFIPTKPGRRKASIFLNSPLGLALRIQRTSIIAWLVGMFVLGISYGSILGDLEGFLSSNDILGQMLPTAEGMSLTERFVSMLMTILSIIGTVPTLLFVLKLYGEEKRNRTEQLLAKAVSRNRIIGGYTFIGVVTAPLIQLMSILGLWSAAEVVMDEVMPFSTFLKAGLVQVPAMWIMVGLAMLLIGYLPRLTGLTWAYLGYSFFVVYLGDMLKLPGWMSDLSPFGHVPQIPMEEINTAKLAVLVLVAVVLVVEGFIGYNKRDIEG